MDPEVYFLPHQIQCIYSAYACKTWSNSAYDVIVHALVGTGCQLFMILIWCHFLVSLRPFPELKGNSWKITSNILFCIKNHRLGKQYDKFFCVVCQRYGLAVPRAGDKPYVTGSIRGCSRSHLT